MSGPTPYSVAFTPAARRRLDKLPLAAATALYEHLTGVGDAAVVVLRYRARISFDAGPGITCWHTDCYRLRDEAWQVVWSQATAITS